MSKMVDLIDVLINWFLIMCLGTLTILIGFGLWKVWELIR